MKAERVTDYMTPWTLSARLDDNLGEVRSRLLTHDISSLAVIDDDRTLLGVISRTDILNRTGLGEDVSSIDDQRAGDVMTRDPVSVVATASVIEAAHAMMQHSIHRVFVTEGGRLEGVLSTRDVMRVVSDRRVNKPVREFSSSPVFTIGVDEPLSEANDLLRRARLSGLVVTDHGFPVGIYTQREALHSSSQGPTSSVETSMNPAIACTPPGFPIFRAASQAIAMRVRRVIVVNDVGVVGVVTGLDFTRAYAGPLAGV